MLGRHIANTSGPWRAAVLFLAMCAILMVIVAATVLKDRYNPSCRIFGYLFPSSVRFFISLLLHAYANIRRSMKRDEVKTQCDVDETVPAAAGWDPDCFAHVSDSRRCPVVTPWHQEGRGGTRSLFKYVFCYLNTGN